MRFSSYRRLLVGCPKSLGDWGILPPEHNAFKKEDSSNLLVFLDIIGEVEEKIDQDVDSLTATSSSLRREEVQFNAACRRTMWKHAIQLECKACTLILMLVELQSDNAEFVSMLDHAIAGLWSESDIRANTPDMFEWMLQMWGHNDNEEMQHTHLQLAVQCENEWAFPLLLCENAGIDVNRQCPMDGNTIAQSYQSVFPKNT